jgi:cytochrome c oxidase cbb3-type subunit III
MHAQARLIAVVVAVAGMTGFGLAQGAAPQGPPPAGQAPAPAPPAGRGAGPGEQAPPPGGGARRGGFAQFTRPLASPDVLARGKALYETNCASCHAPDLRGTVDGKNPNLLRSGTALNDKQGELITAAIAKHTPPVTLMAADSTAVAEYIHSVHATMGGQGSPPPRSAADAALNILVGDPAAGQTYFASTCATCHSVTGDLKGIGSKFTDPRALQNAWVAGSSGRFGGGGRGSGGGVGSPATVTLADGSKVEGTLVRKDDWLVILTLPDGTRKSMARTNGVPKVEVKDASAAHKKMVLELDDADNKRMHDVTAYLWSVK